MKKLMIAAATTAIAGGVFGATAQVYDMTLTVKATECAQAKKAYKNVCEENILLYRKQTTQKFYGKFWGCGCEVIACPGNYGQPRELDTKSFMFWGKSAAFHNAEMEWSLLQLVGQKGTNIEGAFNLKLSAHAKDDTVGVAYDLNGAGYGTATVKACADADNSIKSMSGNVVGIYNVEVASEVNGCKYCGESAECTPWDFCDACGTKDDALSAAFGSFTIKYNASQAKKLAAGKWIDEANKFSKFVTDEFACIAAEGTTPETTPNSAAQANYTAAKKAYADATDALAAAEALTNDLNKGVATCEQGKALTNALKNATRALQDASSDLTTAMSDYNSAGGNVPAVKAAQDAVDATNIVIEAKKALIATSTVDSVITTAKKDLEDLEEALENAQKALENARVAAVKDDTDGSKQKKLDEFDAAYAEKTAAEKAVKEAKEAFDAANKAWNTWQAGSDTDAGSYAKAKKDADAAVADAKKNADDAKRRFENAELACSITGTDCK